jgi:hypothetical protein
MGSIPGKRYGFWADNASTKPVARPRSMWSELATALPADDIGATRASPRVLVATGI